jgi:glycosyltransferase involved in cell wall biosynthesis
VRVLAVNHTSQVSGGERSLLLLLSAFPRAVTAALACPPGDLAREASALGVRVLPIPSTDCSLKLHPWRTARGLAELGAMSLAVRRHVRAFRPNVVHANSIRAGLVTAGIPLHGRIPVIVHVRDALPEGRASTLTLNVLGRSGSMLVANSAYTAQRIASVEDAPPPRIVHNAVDLDRFDPARMQRAACRARLGLPDSAPVLAVLAQITPWKGQDDAVRILAGVKASHPDARLLLIGSAKFVSKSTRYDNTAYLESLRRLIAELGLSDDVELLGERADVPEILRAVDVVLVPSWEEPFGRTVIEAMAMEVPVVATAVGGPSEVIRDGEDGFLLLPRQPERWVPVVDRLLSDPHLRASMGRSARLHAHRFRLSAHVEAVMAVYEDLLETNGGRGS